jgi:hypothetical protein
MRASRRSRRRTLEDMERPPFLHDHREAGPKKVVSNTCLACAPNVPVSIQNSV